MLEYTFYFRVFFQLVFRLFHPLSLFGDPLYSGWITLVADRSPVPVVFGEGGRNMKGPTKDMLDSIRHHNFMFCFHSK